MNGAREASLLYARLAVHKRRIQQAREIIVTALQNCRRPYVSLSCGKDSVVLADLVTNVAAGVPLRFLSSGETRLLHDVDRVLDHFKNRGACVQELNVDRVFSGGWAHSSWDESRRAGRSDLQHFSADYDAAFIGLRAEESAQRRMTLYHCQTAGLPRFVYRMASGRLRVCPLAEWRTEDVGAYAATHGLPLLAAYDDGLDTRTTARLTGTAVRMGTLARLRERDPDAYFRLLDRWPELRSAEVIRS